MVSKQDIKDLDFDTIEEYFSYILQSRENGQYKQAKELYRKLSKDQRAHFRIHAANYLYISIDDFVLLINDLEL